VCNLSFIILINGAPSIFFKASRSLEKGCPLSPYLVIIVVEDLRNLLNDAKFRGVLKKVKVSNLHQLPYYFCSSKGSLMVLSTLKRILTKIKNISFKLVWSRACQKCAITLINWR